MSSKHLQRLSSTIRTRAFSPSVKLMVTHSQLKLKITKKWSRRFLNPFKFPIMTKFSCQVRIWSSCQPFWISIGTTLLGYPSILAVIKICSILLILILEGNRFLIDLIYRINPQWEKCWCRSIPSSSSRIRIKRSEI